MNNKYKLITLKNNLRVLLYPRPELHSVILNCWIKAGSADDPKNKYGLAHLLEHLVLERTNKMDKKQFAEVQEQLAGDFFASIGETFTIVEGEFHYSKLDMSLSLLKDIVFGRSFLPSQIADAKKVIIEEIRQIDDNLTEVVSRYAKAIRYKNQPSFSFPVCGDAKSLKKISQNDVDSFCKKHYLPENMVLGIAGNFGVNLTVRQIEKIFNDVEIPQHQPVKKTVIPVEYSDQTMKFIPKRYSEIYTMITFPGLSRKNSALDRLAMNLIAFMLTGVSSSRLFKLLRLEDNLVYDVTAETSVENDFGVFDISWACQAENFSQIINKVTTELKNFKEGKINFSEIQRFCDILNKSNEMNFDNLHGGFNWLIDDFAYDNAIVLPEEIIKIRNEITPAKVEEIAKKIFDFKKINVIATGPVKNIKLPPIL